MLEMSTENRSYPESCNSNIMPYDVSEQKSFKHLVLLLILIAIGKMVKNALPFVLVNLSNCAAPRAGMMPDY